MIRVLRNNRLSGVTVSVLLIGAAGLLAPAAAPAYSPPAETGALPATAGTVLPAAVDRTPESLRIALEALAADTATPDRTLMRQAFVAAGFAADSVEVSMDMTPTGLEMDSSFGAAAEAGSCIFGEVREGRVSVSVLPVLDSGYCFVGDQR